MPHILAGKSVLVVAHRNPLKAVLEHFSNASQKGVEKGAFDTQTRSTLPFVLEFIANEAGKATLLTEYSLNSLAPQLSPRLRTVGKVVFLRHGQSECNLKEAFTGWEDSGLTPKGEKEAEDAGRFLCEEGYKFDTVFTSFLTRAQDSVQRICMQSGNTGAPVVKSWRLNARMPGVLQGLTKPEAEKLYGKKKVNLWRGSFDVMPDCVPLSDPRHPASDPLYAGVPPQDLPPGGESLQKVIERSVPFWRDHVVPRIKAGETILIVGHKNSMKALFMYLEDSTEHDMFDVVEVSSTVPLVFEFGDSGYSSGVSVAKKYWVKHTMEEAKQALAEQGSQEFARQVS